MSLYRAGPQETAASPMHGNLYPPVKWRAKPIAHQERHRVLGVYPKDAHRAVDRLRVRDVDTGLLSPGPLHLMSAIRMLRVDVVQRALEAGLVVPAEVVEKLAYTVPDTGASYGHCMFEREFTRRERPIVACLRAAPQGVDAATAVQCKQRILVFLALAGVRPTLWEHCLLRLTPKVRWPKFAGGAVIATAD